MSARRDDGAAAVTSVAIVTLVVALAAFAVDLGMQRVVRSDMQAVADVVALDAARLLDGRTAQEIRDGDDDKPKLQQAVDDSVARNTAALGAPPEVEAVLVHTETAANGAVVPRRDAAGALVPVAAGERPDAVLVSAAGEVDFAFAPGSGAASRSALGASEGGACFTIGSFAARLDAGGSPMLGPVLGAIDTDLELGVLDYRMLADAEVSLLGLLDADLGAGTLREVVDLGTAIPLANFYAAVATVLQQESGSAATVTLLQLLSTRVGSLSVPLGDILALDTGGTAGMEADLNVLDLVAASAFASDGNNAASVPELAVNLDPITNARATAHVVQAPQTGCGRKDRAVARSSQIDVELTASAVELDLGLISTRVSLDGDVGVAVAEGTLRDVRCRPEGIAVEVDDGLLEVDLTLEIRVTAAFLPAITGPITLRGTRPAAGGSVAELEFLDPGDYDSPATVGATGSGLPWLEPDTSGLRALGLPLGSSLSWVLEPLLEGLVNPLVQSLDSALLTPLLQSLGLSVTGADVYGLPTPSCGQPKLIG